MAVELGSGYVSLVPSAQGFGGAVSGVLDTELAGVGERAGGQVGGGLLTGFGGALGQLGAIGGAAAVGLGVAAFQIGSSFDDAFDTIRVGTGATGDALSGLEDSFRGVVHDVPTDFGSAADAVTALNQRLHLTGEPLEGLAGQFLNLSRITETDLNSNLETGTRLFGDWGIAAEDGAGALDELFRAGQASGVSFDQLSASMVTFGAPLRQLGFSFEESAAMIARFQSEGVNAELVMGSMRQALGRMARAGEEPIDTFRRTTWQIQHAGTTAEANAIALELFGARAGPDMAAAIREGRFELDSLVDTIANGSDTIGQASADTADFGEKWTLIKNRVLLALEPIAMRVFNAVGTAMDNLGPIVDNIMGGIRAFGAAWTAFDGDVTSSGFAGFMEQAGFQVRSLWEALQPVVATIVQFVRDHLPAFAAGLGLIISPIGALIAGLVLAYNHFEGFRNVVDTVARFLVDVIAPAIAAFVGYVAEQFGNLVGWVQQHWAAIQEAIGHVTAAITAIVTPWIDAFKTAWGAWGDEILRLLHLAWDQIAAIVEAALGIVRGVIDFVLSLINGDWGGAWDAIKDIVSTVWDLISGTVDRGINAVKEVISGVLDTLKGIWQRAWDTMKGVVSGVWDGIGGAFRGVINGVLSILEGGINLAIDLVNRAVGALDSALGPYINFGEISHVHIPRIGGSGGGSSGSIPSSGAFATGGWAQGFVDVGEAGPEKIWTPGSFVIPNHKLMGHDSAAAEGVSVQVFLGDEDVTDLMTMRVLDQSGLGNLRQRRRTFAGSR